MGGEERRGREKGGKEGETMFEMTRRMKGRKPILNAKVMKKSGTEGCKWIPYEYNKKS